MKNALVCVLNIAMYTTPTSSLFIWPVHMRNALVGVVYIAMFKTPTIAFFIYPSFTPIKSPIRNPEDRLSHDESPFYRTLYCAFR